MEDDCALKHYYFMCTPDYFWYFIHIDLQHNACDILITLLNIRFFWNKNIIHSQFLVFVFSKHGNPTDKTLTIIAKWV